MAARHVLGGSARRRRGRHGPLAPADFPQRTLLHEITFGVVLFTLLVQGTTTDFVMRRTGTGAPEAASSR
jgi:NhaP-type Na+/H+ or K+/H+ antiporter